VTWAIIPGTQHGGLPPQISVDPLTIYRGYEGDSITITGSGFTPGTQVILNPGNILAGTSMPTVTDEITFTIPVGIPNVMYSVSVNNGGSTATSTNLFVVKDITFTTSTGQAIDVLIGVLN
jgi:hypothetical protein